MSGHQRVRACRELGIVTILGEVRHYDNHDGRCAEDWVIKDLIETNVRQRGNIGGSELKAVHRVDELRRIYKVDGGGKHKSCDNVTTSGEPVTAEELAKLPVLIMLRIGNSNLCPILSQIGKSCWIPAMYLPASLHVS